MNTTGDSRLYVSTPKPLPPFPSAGGTYVLNDKGTEWLLEQQTAAPSPEILNPQTDGTDAQSPAAGEI